MREIRNQLIALATCALLTLNAGAQTPLSLQLPHSWNPIRAYTPDEVPQASIANSAGINGLIHDGKMYLSLQDAIELALQNNLDLAIARYNLPIAEADIERTKAGATFRGVNTGIVQNTLGGGVGGLGSGAPGAGAGGTTGGAGGAGAGASGLVQSTLGSGTTVSSYDPEISGVFSIGHNVTPLSNEQVNGVPTLDTNTTTGNFEYQQAFPTGTSFTFDLQTSRVTENGLFTLLNPTLNGLYQVTIDQQLLAGFGLGPNLRYLHIARNDKKISDIAFKSQVIATITQIADIYWDFVNAYQDEIVKQESLKFAQDVLATDKQQLSLQAIPELDVMKAEGEVAARDGDLAVAKTTLELQELLIKNALTKNLDDAQFEAVPVIPTDTNPDISTGDETPLSSLIDLAMRSRAELDESTIDLQNRDISRRAARNALLPSATLEAYYGGTGLAGINNPLATSDAGVAPDTGIPTGYGGALQKTFNNSSPNYLVGINVQIPIRNRVAKSDQYRSELEFRQAELLQQQLRKQIHIEVRNAQFALEQSTAHLTSAQKARDVASVSFKTIQQEQKLGAASTADTLAAHHELALREEDVATAQTVYEKARVELDRATGQTLASYHVSVEDARQGIAANQPPTPGVQEEQH